MTRSLTDNINNWLRHILYVTCTIYYIITIRLAREKTCWENHKEDKYNYSTVRIFWKNSTFTTKHKGRYRDFLKNPCPPSCAHSLSRYQHHSLRMVCLLQDDPTLTHHNSKSKFVLGFSVGFVHFMSLGKYIMTYVPQNIIVF